MTPEQERIYNRWVSLYGTEPIRGLYLHMETVTSRMKAGGSKGGYIRGYIDGMLDIAKLLRSVVDTAWGNDICEALSERMK